MYLLLVISDCDTYACTCDIILCSQTHHSSQTTFWITVEHWAKPKRLISNLYDVWSVILHCIEGQSNIRYMGPSELLDGTIHFYTMYEKTFCAAEKVYANPMYDLFILAWIRWCALKLQKILNLGYLAFSQMFLYGCGFNIRWVSLCKN